MKKSLLILLGLWAVLAGYSQVQRNVVVLEIGTGTWCTYCPGAANGAAQLLTTGAHVAVIEYHNGDGFVNAASNARNSYYGITGYPTAHFDGIGEHVGGAACPTGNVYSDYLPLYTTAYATASPLIIDISGTNTGNVYNVVLSVKKLATLTGSDLKLHLVLTETNIATAPWPGGSGCMTAVHDVERLMVPSENGTDISFASGDMQVVTLQFTKDASWVLANCELIAFVQDNSTKTIFNGSKIALNALPAPVTVDFSGTPVTGCSPVTVNFTDLSTGVTDWQWNCTGGTPAAPSTANPSVTYNSGGNFDVTLTAWNNSTNRGNKMTKPAFVTISSAPIAASQPNGNTGLCVNSPDASYSTMPVPDALTYTWDLQPPTAGVLTPSSTNCIINWDNTYSGTAQLKVRASNTCGDGPWSTALAVTISTQPGIPGTPTGTSTLCINPANTVYSTAGTSPVTSYFWELLPTTAGTVTGSSSSCTVNWSDSYTGTATLKVKGINVSCDGPWSTDLTITIDGGPAMYSVTGGGTYCATTGTGLPIGVDGSQTGMDYTLYLNGTATSNVVSGTGSAITFGNQSQAGTYTVVGQNMVTTCIGNMNGSSLIFIDPQVPAIPGTPQGPVQPNAGTDVNYTTSGGQYAATYTWDVTPAAAGNATGNTTTGTISWNTTYTGPAQVKVQGINSCGSGTFSTDYDVVVLPPVGIGNLSGKKLATLTPNPAKGIVRLIPVSDGVYGLKVHNSMGARVMNIENLEIRGAATIDISNLKGGVYYFSLTNRDASQVMKIVILD